MFWRKPVDSPPVARAIPDDPVAKIVPDDARQARPAPVPSLSERCLYLGRDRILVQAAWGGWMVVPSFNVDVAVGVVRDGVIEPWTTRLVQELLRPGQTCINAGSNYGYYPVLAGHSVGPEGRVIAVEANPTFFPTCS